MFTFPAAVLSGTGTCPFCPLLLLVVKKKQRRRADLGVPGSFGWGFHFSSPSNFYSRIKMIPTPDAGVALALGAEPLSSGHSVLGGLGRSRVPVACVSGILWSALAWLMM